jgi:hypothetical protein
LTSEMVRQRPKMTRKFTTMRYDRFDRGVVSIARATAIAVALCFGAAALAPAMPGCNLTLSICEDVARAG